MSAAVPPGSVPVEGRHIAPEISPTELNFDPIARRNVATTQEFVAEATEIVDRNAPSLSPEDRARLIGRLSGLKRDEARRAGEAQRTEQAGGKAGRLLSLSSGVPALANRIRSFGNSASTLDALNLGGLRNPETVGDLLPIAGATAFTAIPILRRSKIMADPAKRAMLPIIDTGQAMLKARGIELGAAGLGAVFGGILDVRLQDAAAYINGGGETTDTFAKAPVIGAFVLGQGSAPFAEQGTKLLNRAMQEVMLESMGFGLGQAGPSAFKAITKRLAGSEAYLRQTVEDALRVPGGVPVGIVDATNSAPASFTRKVLGVFGLLSGPFSQPLTQRGLDLRNAANRIASGLSTDLGVIMDMAVHSPGAAARLVARFNSGAFNQFAEVFNSYVTKRNGFWNDFVQLSEKSNVIVVPANTRATAAVQLGRFFNKGIARSLKKGVKEQIEGLSKADLEVLADDVFEEIPVHDDLQHLKDLFVHIERLEPSPSVAQMDMLGKRVAIALDNVKSNTAKGRIIEIQKAINLDIEDNLIGADDAVLAARNKAKSFTEEWITLLQGTAGSKVARVTGDFGESRVQFLKKPATDNVDDLTAPLVKNVGSVDSTEFIDTMMDNPSIGEVEQMWKMLKSQGSDGKKAFRDMVGRKIQKVFAPPVDPEDVFNPAKVAKSLGFGDVAGKKRSAFVRMVELAGGDVKDIQRVLSLSEKIFRDGVINVSQFAARRAALGGLGAGLGASGAFVLGRDSETTLGSAAFMALAFVALGRGAGRLLTNPRHTKSLLIILDPSFGNGIRTRAARRLASSGFFGTRSEIDEEESQFNALAGNVSVGFEDIRNSIGDMLRSTARNVEPGAAVKTPLPSLRPQ